VDPRTDYLLRLGDDALVLGQRLGEWCGHGPVLEVDISLANLALDLVGQATLLLDEAGDGDRLAFHRDVLDFRNCLLVEQPNGDFAQTIARHLLYSTWQHMLLQRLTQSSDRFLREFSAKAVKEIAYHRELASEWAVRLGKYRSKRRSILLLELARVGRDALVDRRLECHVDLEQLGHEPPAPFESFGHAPPAFLSAVAKPDRPIGRELPMISDFLDRLVRELG
jgi:hypothetical protein